MSEAIWGTVIGGVIVGVLGWLWSQRIRLQRWWARGNEEANEAAERVEDEQLATLREQVVERARKLGIRLPVKRLGDKVTYSDGSTATFIPDHQTYRRQMESRQVDLFITFNKKSPTPLSWRDRAWLEQWLADNPEP